MYRDAVAETKMIVAQGEFELRRPHTPESSPLRAWSAADQLLLDELASGGLGRLLIVNDEFGALTVALAPHQPVVWSDSVLSRSAIAANLAANGQAELAEEQIITGEQTPAGSFDTVLLRVPKTSALLDHQLQAIGRGVTGSSRVVGTGMVRHIHRSTLASFERWIGETKTSLAKRKARLIYADVAAAVATTAPSTSVQSSEFVTDDGVTVVEMPGTFSAGHVDVGTALLIDVLRDVDPPAAGASVVDLGCGNGIVGASLAAQWRSASFELLDVSDLAVAAAQKTWERNGLGSDATIRAADGLTGVADASVDVVVTNPPFHQGHALDRDLTDRLLADAARVLAANGSAYVVVQRHLKLHATMARWFDSVETISKHPTHVVLEVRGPKR